MEIRKRMGRIGALFLALLVGVSACGNAPEEVEKKTEMTSSAAEGSSTRPKESTASEKSATTRTIKDRMEREVEVPAEIHTIICNGSNALRMVSYLQATDRLVGVEEADMKYETSTKRDYAHVYYEQFKDLPPIGKGGGTSYTAYPEEILKVKPDVILSAFVEEAADQLQQETGIPVVSVRCPSSNFIDENWYAALRLTAELTGTQERAEQLLQYIDQCKDDLKTRAALVPEEDKPTAYTGAVTFSGAHGFTGTYANFGPFLAIDAKNVADETGEKAAFDVDLEKVLVWDPEVIFLDPGNRHLVDEEYASNPDFFQSLQAVKNGRVYTMPSFNNYSTNITYCLMNAYWAGKVLYPQAFSDVDMKAKSAEIMQMFLGEDYFDEMEADGLYYGKWNFGE